MSCIRLRQPSRVSNHEKHLPTKQTAKAKTMVHGLVVAMSCRAVRCDAIEMRFADACTRPEDRLASDTVSLSLGMVNRPLSDPLPKTRGPRTPSSQRAPLSSRVLRSTTNHSVVDWWHYDVLRTYEHCQQASQGRRHDTTPFSS